jgi:hypothetical protein
MVAGMVACVRYPAGHCPVWRTLLAFALDCAKLGPKEADIAAATSGRCQKLLLIQRPHVVESFLFILTSLQVRRDGVQPGL